MSSRAVRLGAAGGVRGSPAWFNGTIYYGDSGGTLKAFSVMNAKLSAAPTSQSAISFAYPGASPVVSASGTTNAIVWAHENTPPPCCMRTTLRTSRKSFTTATKPPAAATNSALATSS